ncbi:hypothetical protein BCR25_14365 [Enterococcus termitis]|uniref:Uncharacterized protein n=1 Tax=Enterococcus termitis TaxID=332950 RepID=A0A1E5H4X4_9ENTE|nr:hypothetical protein BCR25_14365 [Enterococcus termitis]
MIKEALTATLLVVFQNLKFQVSDETKKYETKRKISFVSYLKRNKRWLEARFLTTGVKLDVCLNLKHCRLIFC